MEKIKYTFAKDPDGYAKMARMKKGDKMIFAFWFYDSDLAAGETKTEYVDRMLREAGYESREHFWILNHNLPQRQIKK